MSKLLLQEDFKSTLLESLGKEGRSISSLAKDLERSGYKIHRLIITGYLRALADMGLVKEKDVPPSKVYIPLKIHDDNVYTRANQAAKETSSDPDSRTLQILAHLLRRPVFESELRMAGVDLIKGKRVDSDRMKDMRASMPKRLRARFPAGEPAYEPDEYLGAEDYTRALESLSVSMTQCRHLVLDSRQSKLL